MSIRYCIHNNPIFKMILNPQFLSTFFQHVSTGLIYWLSQRCSVYSQLKGSGGMRNLRDVDCGRCSLVKISCYGSEWAINYNPQKKTLGRKGNWVFLGCWARTSSCWKRTRLVTTSASLCALASSNLRPESEELLTVKYPDQDPLCAGD